MAAKGAAASKDPLADIDARVERLMTELEVPGLSVAVVHDGEIVLARGYGLREQGKPDPVDEHTVFAIASNTKAFLATLVGMLVDEGELGWDDRVVDHLPKFRAWDEYTTREIRVEDLLAHRSGLATWAGDVAWLGSKIDTAGMMAALEHVEASWGLRRRYGYSNLMFMVAGEVIRAITGQGWDAMLRARILDPLEMTRTSTSVEGLAGQENVATPHIPDPDGEGMTTIPYLNVDAAGASAALNSSAADMARWLQLQLANGQYEGKQLVPAKVIETLRVPQTALQVPDAGLLPGQHFVLYGLGWFLYDYHGRKVVTHGGGLFGMTSRVGMVPEEGLGVVVLTNSESSASVYLFMEIMDAFLGVESLDFVARERERKAEADAAKKALEDPSGEPSAPPKAYAGTYRNPLLGRAEVSLENDGLHVRLPDHGGLDCPLRHVGADVFDCEWSNPIYGTSRIPFEVKKGKATQLKFRVRPSFVDPLEYTFTQGRVGAR